MNTRGVLAAALVAALLLGLSSPPSQDVHEFSTTWQRHEMTFVGDGFPGTDYHTLWEIDLPAPKSTPTAVEITLRSKYRYKYVVFNVNPKGWLYFWFLEPNWKTTVELQGRLVSTKTEQLPSIRASVEPGGVFWGQGRPKAFGASVQQGSLQGGWEQDDQETWTLRVVGSSGFGFASSGPAVFTEVVKQRLVGSVTYLYE